MKKKEYIRPEISVVQMVVQPILTTSQVGFAQESDYTDDEVDDYWENEGFGDIWAD